VVTVGRLFVFMEATSPKAAISSVIPGKRFTPRQRATGHGTCVSSGSRALLAASTIWKAIRGPNVGSAIPRDERFLLDELSVGSAFSTTYGSDGRPRRQRRRAN
jgi:hypothetical protein